MRDFTARRYSVDMRRKPPAPPGQLVSLETHRLHLYRTGHGTPPVVFDAALGGSSLSWTYVQPAVAEFTTACAYDRAGFGWSDAGPLPRTGSCPMRHGSAILGAEGPPGGPI